MRIAGIEEVNESLVVEVVFGKLVDFVVAAVAIVLMSQFVEMD